MSKLAYFVRIVLFSRGKIPNKINDNFTIGQILFQTNFYRSISINIVTQIRDIPTRIRVG